MPNTKERYGFCQEAQFYESSLLRSSSLFCKQVGAFKKQPIGLRTPECRDMGPPRHFQN